MEGSDNGQVRRLEMGSWSRVTDHPHLGQEGSGQCRHPHVT